MKEVEKKLLRVLQRCEEIENDLNILNELREKGVIDEDQYLKSRQEYDKELKAAKSELAPVQLQIQNEQEAKSTEFEIYQQELTNLKVKLNAGKLRAKGYIKEKKRAAELVARAREDIDFLEKLSEAKSSKQVKEIIISSPQRSDKAELEILRRTFWTAGKIMALAASLLIMISPFLPWLKGLSLYDFASHIQHPIWIHPVLLGLIPPAFLALKSHVWRGAIYFALAILVITTMAILIQGIRIAVEAESVASSQRPSLGILSPATIVFAVGILGVLAAGIVELCRNMAFLPTVVSVVCLTTVASIGNSTFWFGVVKGAPRMRVNIVDLKGEDGLVNGRRARIIIENRGGRALKLFDASKRGDAPNDYALIFQKLRNARWIGQSLVVEESSFQNSFKLPVAVRPHESTSFNMVFSPIWDPNGLDGKDSEAGKYRISLDNSQNKSYTMDFTIEPLPSPNDIAKKELAQARKALEKGDIVGGMNILKGIPQSDMFHSEVSRELNAAEIFGPLKRLYEKPYTKDERAKLRDGLERLIGQYTTATIIPQAREMLSDINAERQKERDQRARDLLVQVKQILSDAERGKIKGEFELAKAKCEEIMSNLAETPFVEEARQLRVQCETALLELDAEYVLKRAEGFIANGKQLWAEAVLSRFHNLHPNVLEDRFRDKLNVIQEWRTTLTYKQLIQECEGLIRSPFLNQSELEETRRKIDQYEELKSNADSTYTLILTNLYSMTMKSPRAERMKKAIASHERFLREYPQSKHAAEVKENLEKMKKLKVKQAGNSK